MKKSCFVIVLAVQLLSLLCQGCSDTQREGSPTFESSSTVSVESAGSESTSTTPSDPANVIICTNIYEITEAEGLYSYALFDKEGNVVKSENNLTREPEITCLENDVVRITGQAGTGIGTQSGYYYDQKNNAVSSTYQCIFDENNGIVAHATKDKVIVESIFNNDFYKEIDTFQKSFSEVAFPFINVEFDENDDIIYVSYYSGSDYAETMEAFALEN